jgi:hypothetical protein
MLGGDDVGADADRDAGAGAKDEESFAITAPRNHLGSAIFHGCFFFYARDARDASVPLGGLKERRFFCRDYF